MKKIKWNWRYFLLHFLITLVIVSVIAADLMHYVVKDRRAAAQSRASSEVTDIQRVIQTGSDTTNILAAWLELAGDQILDEITSGREETDHTQAFERFASTLFDKQYYFSLSLAPDGVIRYIYPRQANESLIGKNLLAGDGREAALLKEAGDPDANRTNRVVVTGPEFVSYIGNCLNVRQPVFRENGDLWGYVSAVLAFPQALEPDGLDILQKSGYSYGIYYEDESGRNRRLTGSLDYDADAARNSFTVQDSTWTLLIRPSSGWVRGREIAFLALTALVLALVIAVMRTLIKSAQSEKLQELQTDAENDQMTGLLNHETAAAMIQKHIKDPLGGVLFMIDIDYFKQVNDQAGHLAGDQVLMDVADALRHTFRRGDVIGRYGGDEFIVYMPGNMSIPDFSVKAAQFQNKVRAISVPGLDRKITCSMGISRKYQDTVDVADLVSCADKALYESKKKGKDCFSIHKDPLRKVCEDTPQKASGKGDFTYKD